MRVVEAGELGVEGGVVGGRRECCSEDRFSLVGLVLAEEDVGEGCGGGGVLRVGGEDAAVGGFGGGEIVGSFGQFAGEKDVVGGLGGDFEGAKELAAGVRGAGGLVDAGDGSVGAGLEGLIVGGEGGGLVEFGAGVG